MNLVFDIVNAALTFWLKPMLVIAILIHVVNKPDFRSAATKHWLLLLAVLSPVLFALFFIFLPRIDIGILPANLASYTQAQIFSFTHSPFAQPNLITLLVLAVYLAGVAQVLFRMLSAILQTQQLANLSTQITDHKISHIQKKLAKDFSLSKAVEVRVSEHLNAPVVWGYLKPQILLPAQYSMWAEDRLLRVLAHEYAHISRGDWISKLLGHLLCAIFWINPLLWRAAKQCSWHAELACDDLVVNKLQCRAEYADDLLELSTDASHHSVVVLAFIKKSELYLRINAILDGGKNRTVPGLMFKGLLLGLVVIMLLPLSVLQAKQSSYVYRYAGELNEASHVVGVYELGDDIIEEPIRKEKFPENKKEYLSLQEIKQYYNEVVMAETLTASPFKFNQTQLAALEGAVNTGIKTDVSIESNVHFKEVRVRPHKSIKIVTPKYPKRALDRNIEATVVVTLDVDIEGKVKNPVIVSSNHSKLFNTTVLNAVKDFVYQPMTINGRPIITRNVKETFVFTIEDAADTQKFR